MKQTVLFLFIIQMNQHIPKTWINGNYLISCFDYFFLFHIQIFLRYTHFVQNSGLRDEVCLVISNKFTTEDGNNSGKEKLGMRLFYF